MMKKAKLKEYRVACHHIDHGHVYVKAENENQALKKADKRLEIEGNEAIEQGSVFHREWDAVQVDD